VGNSETRKMGLYDEIYCDAEVPNVSIAPSSVFQSKSFCYPCMQKYRITKGGRLIDAWGRDLEVEGYLLMLLQDGGPDTPEYRAHFIKGQLQSIVEVDEGVRDCVYGLASYRWFAPGPSSGTGMFCDVPDPPATGQSPIADASQPTTTGSKFLIHPDLARSAKVEWPDVDLDKSSINQAPTDPDMLARQLAGLGYPGFAHLDHAEATPAAVLRDVVIQKDLEVRLTEALPWVVLTYPDLDWPWLIREVKLWDAQNRLGFIVAMAEELAATRPQFQPALEQISAAAKVLERARLAREDTLCRESMPPSERDWLSTTRSSLARHWNLLTGLTADQLLMARGQSNDVLDDLDAVRGDR
jgi:hypothetical protein